MKLYEEKLVLFQEGKTGQKEEQELQQVWSRHVLATSRKNAYFISDLYLVFAVLLFLYLCAHC